MREIKFRGLPTCKDKDELDYINFDRDGNFAVGFYEDGYIIGKVADASDDYISPEFWVAVDRNTVGQYTGLHDKNGREIYEGDIVDIGLENQDGKLVLAPVIYGEYIAGYVLDNGGNGIWQRLTEDCEVIGNVFEDGGLIDGKGSATN
ncbi:YopX family protein [Schleiferilactobacillus harbinensis]|uniref:YopX family protein n=1 Tax=Schleiferilactobacillus harbinensis TaxID=304207 RepID=UPI00345E74BA